MLRPGRLGSFFGGPGFGQFVRFAKPVCDRRFHFIPMLDVDDVHGFGFRCPIDAPYLTRLQRTAEEHADFQKISLRTHEEIAGFAREHDRLVRGVDSLISKLDGCLAQAFPGLLKILRQILREGRFRCRPAVVLLACLDPLLAVIAFSAGHVPIVIMRDRLLSKLSRRTRSPVANRSRRSARRVSRVVALGVGKGAMAQPKEIDQKPQHYALIGSGFKT